MTAALESLLARLPADLPVTERDRVRRAYDFAARRHAGQCRKSGDPYITHPVAVAQIAACSGLDDVVVCAALLHDVIEDTGCHAVRLREQFGDEIATMVESMIELDRDEAAIAAAADRVLTLKVLDRLHNMRTLRYLDEDKQRLKSRHTLESMVPLARRLGLRDVSEELASIALDRLASLPEDAPAGHRALALGALLLPPAARARYLDEWLGEIGALPSRRARAHFTLRLILGMPALSLTLRRPAHETLTHRLLVALRWILRTDLRTWTPLVLLVGWVVVETSRTSLVDATVTLITVPPVLHAGVTRLRTKLGIDDSDQTSS
ncbi:HD domain-containing protein [Actinomadura sp. 6K520]|uniref:HD domain-containing protein n=1 Tax=Actinomadura sp. 6K520 TaxID=2530364 RepID=UPI0010516451|nr:HD domain-containing protein [Actinomadura sp. 6K520]TDE26524.1 HD domain-containing protein [Actinomadura sp. 6K520]